MARTPSGGCTESRTRTRVYGTFPIMDEAGERPGRHRYYYAIQERALRFLIPREATVLYYGSARGEAFPDLQPRSCVVVDQHTEGPPASWLQPPQYMVHRLAFHQYAPESTFDYVVLNDALGETDDICEVLKRVSRACHSRTRVIINQHNHLWQAVLTAAGKLGYKNRERTQNWLSIGDLRNHLGGMGFDLVRTHRHTLMPVDPGGLGAWVNNVAAWVPGLDPFMLDQFIVARFRHPPAPDAKQPGLTICVTVRDERENVEPLVRSIPDICPDQELLFVEGHSTDGTREEIERVIAAHPGKRIRCIGQPGRGQGDAIRAGFRQARGDIIILYEGDGTSDPRDLAHFYDAMREGRYEFIEGTRFVYPLESTQMPTTNKIGNILFARWFSYFLGQHATDVLSGIKAIGKAEFDMIDRSWGFLGVEDPFGDFELLYGAARFGLRVGELPMRYAPRTYGQTKTHVVRHGLRLLRMTALGHQAFRSARVADEECP